jgi:hypothetical protein
MVSQASIQAKVAFGLGKAATALGAPCPWYRPSGPGQVIAAANSLGTLQVLLDTSAGVPQLVPEAFEKPAEWFGAFDTTGVQAGDYIVAAPATDGVTSPFFVAALDWFRPARLVRCNNVVTVCRPPLSARSGLNPYGANTLASETAVLTQWPAAITTMLRVARGDVELPGEAGVGRWTVMLPTSVPADLRTSDIVILQDGARAIVTTSELTPLGWRLGVEQAAT